MRIFNAVAAISLLAGFAVAITAFAAAEKMSLLLKNLWFTMQKRMNWFRMKLLCMR